jgi:hypothetical protein
MWHVQVIVRSCLNLGQIQTSETFLYRDMSSAGRVFLPGNCSVQAAGRAAVRKRGVGAFCK